MDLKEGDILQKGLLFYRVYNASRKNVVVNKILYNHKKEALQIFHDYEIIQWEQIGDGKLFTILKEEDPDTVSKLELIKRKYKLQKLNNISDNEENS